MEINKKNIFRIFLAAAGCIILYWLLHEEERVKTVWKFISNLITPFVFGAALAFVLNVPMRAFESLLKKVPSLRARRALAIVLTILAIALVIAGVVMLLIPQLEATLQTLFAQLPIFFGNLERMVIDFLEERPEVLAWVTENIGLERLNWSTLIEKVVSTVGNSLASILNSTISAVGSLAGTIVNLVISVVFAFYCLSSKDVLARQARRLGYAILPEKTCDEAVRILRMTNTSFSNFLTGQCLEAVILALLFVVAMAIFRMPYIPLICVVICVTALVPVVGAFAGCILGAFLILVNDPMQAVTFVIMFLVIQQFEGNVIYPRVVGGSIGLPGMWVLLAVAIGGGFFGVVGMLLMVPFAAVLYTLLREFTHKRLQDRDIDPDKLREHPPVLQSHFKLKLENRKKKRQEKHGIKNEKPKSVDISADKERLEEE
ncbi:MAG: AI-2E family transporter [Oscillospiraceae bacterium]|nr:AI-2E family transporter [Oscillospiraceae bacterium]